MSCIGVSIAEHGYLGEEQDGYPVGTPYVVISADCADERDFAREALEEVAGLPPSGWRHWEPRYLEYGDVVSELWIYPPIDGRP